jgi:hypothetical protein
MKHGNRVFPKQIKISAEEEKAFTKLAEERGTNFSELVRQLLHRELQLSKVRTA